MALTGYIFSSNADIQPLLEDPYGQTSPSLALATLLATRLSCCVVIGFPWGRGGDARQTGRPAVPFSDARLTWDDEGKEADVAEGSEGCYNAALVVDSLGKLVHVFRKHFSYQDDKRWAREGPGFQCITLPRLGKVCVAICMDLNREYWAGEREGAMVQSVD